MLVGMGTVFVFLTLLVLATRVMSAIVLRYFPAAAVVAERAVVVRGDGASEEEIAAISMALTEHLKKKTGSNQ